MSDDFPIVPRVWKPWLGLPSARGWNGHISKKGEVPLDPWGNAYEYRFPSSNVSGFEIVSFGADGREGGSGEAADVSS